MIIWWKALIEILILWFVIYRLLLFIKGTRAVQILIGLIVVLFTFLLTQQLHLDILSWILTKLLTLSVFAFLIIFQPELRRGLAHIGGQHVFGSMLKEEQIIDEIIKACVWLSKRKIGALIAIEREVGLKTYIESGILIDSKVSTELLTTIFIPDVPMHDGGTIIEGDRIAAAGCLFPLTQNPHITKTMGTRHRAAMGLTEETDAVCIVVSEETGSISMAKAGKLVQDMNEDNLRAGLLDLYRPKESKSLLRSLLQVKKEKDGISHQ